MRADQIVKLLAARHSRDVFVSECKMGSTYGGRSQRMDAWALRRSWTKACCTGYEIKVARSDFLRDDKWCAYLPYCNEFYFVAPAGVIDVSETPDGVGLCLVSKTGTKLFTKRKAPFRNAESGDLEDIFRYVLISRADITKEYRTYERGAEFWRDLVEERNADLLLGHAVGKVIKKTIADQIHAVKTENKKLRDKIASLAEAKAILAELGIERSHAWNWRTRIEDAVRHAQDNGLGAALASAETAMAKLRGCIDGVLKSHECENCIPTPPGGDDED